MRTKLILNADDFGRSSEINAAVMEAHDKGVLSSASLMVTGDAVEEAVAIAKKSPGLAVGLHICLSDGRGKLSPEIIPSLVDGAGMFRSNPALAGFHYYFSGRVRKQLTAEIEAQFQAFADTGLTMSHVDGHQHLHAHPAVLPIVVDLAVKYGARGFRIPRDPFRENMRGDRSARAYKLAIALAHGYLAGLCRRKLNGRDLAVCEMSIGALMVGRMSADYVVNILSAVHAETIELYFHPTIQASGEMHGPNSGDFDTLLSPKLKQFILERDYEVTNYAGLKG